MPLIASAGFATLAVGGVLAGALIVLAAQKARRSLLNGLISFAVGSLLGATFLGLIPEAAVRLPVADVGAIVLVGILAFFLLEKWVLWRHCHRRDCPVHSAAGYLILIGDAIHNLTDGLALGAAFAVDPALGVTVGIAVVAHEVPQEVGDFALLLDSGLAPLRALGLNLLAALTIFPGVLIGATLTEGIGTGMGIILALTAGGFLYVALADLVPDLHKHWEPSHVTLQFIPIGLGIGLIWAVHHLPG